MKKIFTLFAVAALAFAAQANVLTVCDGEYQATGNPVYGLWYDTEGITQQIYPADMLAEMAGGKITEITFTTIGAAYEEMGYTYEEVYDADYRYYISFDGAPVVLALREIDELGFEDAVAFAGATVVATADPVKGTSTLTFVLNEPFQYNGGNLLVEATYDGTGSYGSTYFWGAGMVDDDGYALYYPSYYAYTNYSGTLNGNLSAFLPMATFTYEAGTTPVEPTERTDSPSASKVNYVEHDGDDYWNAYTVTLTPAETEPDCVIWYRIGVMEDGEYVFGEWTEYVAPFNVDQPGSYRIEAYAITEGKLESYPIADEFVVSKLTDVEELFAGKTVANVRYFNVAGQEMQQANGLTIMVTTFTDGTQSTVKVVK